VNDKTQSKKQSAAQASQAQGGGSGRDGDGRPKADPILTRRFEALEQALHGARAVRTRGPLNWSGVNETTVVFTSIEQALNGSVPVDRPTSDLPPDYDQSKAGG
jgi:hypothetical protein